MFSSSGSIFGLVPTAVVYQNFIVQSYCATAALGFLCYEYLITLDKELEYFWRKRPSAGSLLFLFNRYLPLLIGTINLCGLARMSSKSCNSLVGAFLIIEPMSYLSCASFIGVRAYALSDRNRSITLFVFVLCLVPIVLGWAQYPWLEARYSSNFGCMSGSSMSPAVTRRMTIAGRVCLISADVIVIYMTWSTALRLGVLRRMAYRSPRPSFWQILFRDGSIHFCTLLVLNTLHLLLALRTATISTDFDPVYYVTTFTEPATAVLVCRFLINVQDVNKHVVMGSDHSFMTSVHPNAEAMYFAKRIDVDAQADEVCLDTAFDDASGYATTRYALTDGSCTESVKMNNYTTA